MQLPDLPRELFDAILHQAILSRGINRALRLRFINKHFAQATLQAFFTFRLLDELVDPENIRDDVELLRSYVIFRAKTEPKSGSAIYRLIAQTAEELLNKRLENPELATFEGCVDAICSVFDARPISQIFEWHTKSNLPKELPGELLLLAGLRSNNLAMVRDCLTSGVKLPTYHFYGDLTEEEHTFLTYERFTSLSIRYCDEELLQYLLTVGKEIVDETMRREFFTEAAKYGGRIDLVRYLWNFKREERPWRVTESGSEDKYLLYNGTDSPDLEVMKFVDGLRQLHPSPGMYKHWNFGRYPLLLRACQAGRMDTIVYAIEHLGASAVELRYWGKRPTNTFIMNAASGGHIPVLDYLGEHGADLQCAMTAAVKKGRTEVVRWLLDMAVVPPAGCLVHAAWRGYRDIVELLLDWGMDLNDDEPRFPDAKPLFRPLEAAILLEHTAMFELLISRGADVRSVSKICVNKAKEKGIESMLLLLEQHSRPIEALHVG